MRRTLTHLVALTALYYAYRSLRTFEGWQQVPSVREKRDDLPAVSIVVPAREEERNIERCVRSLLAQENVEHEVIVVDDRSTDGTGAILEALMNEFPELRVVDGEALPDGWVGKPWACAQGARLARHSWLLFTDADSVHEPHATASTLAFARAQGADALTIMTGQELVSLAEVAIVPAILSLILFAVGTPGEINDPAKPESAIANGQYILVARGAYDALGGHAALRGEIAEDVEFARRLKADGRFRLLVALGTNLVRVRMYRSFGEIWDGFTKNVYLGARGNLPAIGGAVAFCAALSVAPPILALASLRRGEYRRALEAAAVPVLVAAVAARGATYVSLPRAFAFLAPFGVGMFGAIALNSTRKALSGEGFAWRGRVYPARNDAG